VFTAARVHSVGVRHPGVDGFRLAALVASAQ
jgi:hypothetical protein